MVNKSKKRVRVRDFRRAFTKGFEHIHLNLTLPVFNTGTEKMLYFRKASTSHRLPFYFLKRIEYE